MTPFSIVYDAFFRIVTDDMFVEQTREQTEEALLSLLLASIPLFEFPEFPLNFCLGDGAYRGHDHSRPDHGRHPHGTGEFDYDLTLEEINILAMGMAQIWLQQQVTSIENTRQKFSGPDFKLSSQASHLQRLSRALKDTQDEHRRLQMLHSRRGVGADGRYKSNFDMFIKPTTPTVDRTAKRGIASVT